MIFDTWQTLINFGTKPLDESERIFKCTNADIQRLIDSGKLMYGRVTPHTYAGFNRGFYFQPVLIECHLGDYLPKLEREPSVISVDGIKGDKRLRLAASDEFYDLPFWPCSILVNRALFGPQRPREDENTWLNNLTERRRAIAHELLYAKQYSEFYDITTDSMIQGISTPTASEENDLMCPTHIIEKTLITLEKEFGLHLLTPGNFVDADPNFIKAYGRIWLMEYAVSESVWKSQTEKYLQNGVRNYIRTNAKPLSEKISRIIENPHPNGRSFHACIQNGNAHSEELQNLCNEIVDQYKVGIETVLIIIAHTLDLTNGSGI